MARPPREFTEDEVIAVETTLQNFRAYLKGPLFAQQMTQMREVQGRLAKSTDEMNVAISEVETVLVDKYRGMAAAIDLDDDHAPLFWRLHARWGLYVVTPDGCLSPLKNCPRHVRILACKSMADLARMLEVEGE